MTSIKLLHGSEHIIQSPTLAEGKPTNDYGRGFYCTSLAALAGEWACKNNHNGFICEYNLNLEGLNVLDLQDGNHTVLNWIAILLKNRTFTIQNEIERDAREYIISNFAPNTENYDVIKGYRADDSYFSFAQSFISNTLPLRSLASALLLGKLGTQTALVSEHSFGNLSFVGSSVAERTTYFPKYCARDLEARQQFQKHIKNSTNYKNDIFVLDILREEIKNSDERIQRIILE